jgi:hypothetical protein
MWMCPWEVEGGEQNRRPQIRKVSKVEYVHLTGREWGWSCHIVAFTSGSESIPIDEGKKGVIKRLCHELEGVDVCVGEMITTRGIVYA